MNQIFQKVDADVAVSVTDLKRNPGAVMEAAKEQAVAVLNHNRVVGYVISPKVWEFVQDLYDDVKLSELADERAGDAGIEVSIDDLSSDI
jgi:antitoxin StbD